MHSYRLSHPSASSSSSGVMQGSYAMFHAFKPEFFMFGNVLHIERNTSIFLMSWEISGFPEVYIYCSFIPHWSEQRINLQLNCVCFVCPSLFNRRYFPVHSLGNTGNEAQNLGGTEQE